MSEGGMPVREVLCRADCSYEYRYPGDDGEQCSVRILPETVKWLHAIGVPLRAEQQGLLSLILRSTEATPLEGETK